MDELFVPYGVGRPRKFRKPKDLETAFVYYLEERKERGVTWKETENGITGETIIDKEKIKRKSYPISIRDFCVYLGVSRNWWNELPPEFLGVKNKISDYIENHQLNGSLVGEFNANIVSRLLGLTDRIEHTGQTTTIIVNSEEEKQKLESMKDLQI